MTVDFTKFKVKKSIGSEDFEILNIKRELANTLYDRGTGLPCHALAFKLYNAVETVELTTQEYKLLVMFAEECMTPRFIDGLKALAETES